MNPLETYLKEMRDIRSTGAAVAETSFYPALSTLLNEIGKTLKPKVRCVINIANRGAGLPDGGLFTPDQFQKASAAAPKPGQLPSRGVMEAKSPAEDVRTVAAGEQVKRYVAEYGLVLVTNYRDFLLLGCDVQGRPLPMERYTLALSEAAFWTAAAHPQKTAAEHGVQLTEYLKRVMLASAPLATPKDVAWFLASYARQAKARVEAIDDLPALAAVRKGLEEALGMEFVGPQGEHFFRSTLVQTIFYGVFSAWVLWHRERPDRSDAFNWHEAQWSLRVPFIRTLYDEIATPSKLGPLGLVELLDWTAAALNRVTRAAFFEKFQGEHAVQYFYEPFLEAFDPELRKELGVWYTPPEIVQYQVARVDTVLREELGLADGLADPNVVVLDPCCGTGAYLVEVLKRIAETLKAKGDDALIAADLKKAAMTRIFGFEILPAPFVVSHLQLGLMLQELGAPLSAKKDERVGVYLTNALTGWQPPTEEGKKRMEQLTLAYPALAAERDAAEKIKSRDKKVLVVLGNPPYNAFAGVSPEEEQGLVEPYKVGLNKPVADGGWGIRKFNLDDLYVRFFRLAERRIAEMTGQGVVSFISNFSYLSDPSFVVMRQRFLSEFDRLWFDCLNGDSRETGKLTPEGESDPSVFSTEYNREGIRVGTAICVMVRKEKRDAKPTVLFRQFWGVNKRQDLLASLPASYVAQPPSAGGTETHPGAGVPHHTEAAPCQENRHSFRPEDVSAAYNAWPKLPDLATTHYNGPVERRAGALISIDREPLESRMRAYFNPKVSNNEVQAIYASLMMTGNRIVGPEARKKIMAEHKYDGAFVVKYPHKVFDIRWSYLANLRPLFSEPSPDLLSHRMKGNAFFVTRDSADKSPEGPPFYFSPLVCDYDCISGHARHFPVLLAPTVKGKGRKAKGQTTYLDAAPTANLSAAARAYLAALGIADPDHVAQPPSAGETDTHPRAAVPQAKPSPATYRRNLPHIQSGEKPLYITFCTFERWVLPEEVRALVIKHCLHDHGRKYWLHAVTVMPDHVHLILKLLTDVAGQTFGLPEILNGIKGASSHSVNKVLGRHGHVWQDESFDHVLRFSESIADKTQYMWENPVRKGLVSVVEQWPWFWGDWMEIPEGGSCGPASSCGTPAPGCARKNGTAEGGCATYELIWMHALAVGYSPAYLAENADGIRRDWPRIPLPDKRKALEASAELGRQVAALLDTESEVAGVTAGKCEALFKTVAVLSKVGSVAQPPSAEKPATPEGGRATNQLNPDAGDLAVTAGWGHAGKGGVTMPAKGRIVERPYDKAELEAMAEAAESRGLSRKAALALLGADTRDVYLSGGAYWKNVPAKVWEYTIGGYQVIKKWLSYREQELLGRALRAEEAREVTGTARRLAALVLLQPALDENYRRAAKSAYAWDKGRLPNG